VTDRDIDRFADSVLQSWRSSSHADAGIAMAASVAAARQACRLPHLIGAAAVCYGLPAVVTQGGVAHARAADA
jgi:separase